MNKKGFTVIELITTFALVSIISLLLVGVVVKLKDIYVKDGVKMVLKTKQTIMSNAIAKDYLNYNIQTITNCPDDNVRCVIITYEAIGSKRLKIEDTILYYGDATYTLLDGSKFNLPILENDVTNKMIVFNFPIEHKVINGDFGIKLVYQYNNIGNISYNW